MRHQLEAVAGAGYRAIAPDLRGYGGSDKPPRGYDAFTLASDVAGMVRALGARDAIIVGHDWGGYAAWCTAVLHPETRSAASSRSLHRTRCDSATRCSPNRAAS